MSLPRYSPASLEAERQPLAELLVPLASRRTGVVGGMTVLPPSHGNENVSHSSTESPHFERIPGYREVDSTGGSGFDAEEAAVRGLFESVERYCGANSDIDQLLLEKASAGEEFLQGEELPLFTDAQYDEPGFPFCRFDPGALIHWIEGRSLVSGKLRYVPAVLVAVPYFATREAELLAPPVSIGLAAGDCWAKAALRGLLEVVEREAFTIMWMNRLSMPRVVLDPASALARRLHDLLDRTGGKMTFVEITHDLGIPTVLAVLDRQLLGRRLITMGASSKPTLMEAAKKAALEALGCYERVRQEQEKPEGPWVCAPDFSNVEDYVQHCLVYAEPSLQCELDFVTASTSEKVIYEEAAPRRPPEELLLDYTKRVAETGSEVISVTLTTRDVESSGIHVVKTIIPQAVPLNPRHRCPPLAHRRLYTVPRTLGYVDVEPTIDQLNTSVPHPFP